MQESKQTGETSRAPKLEWMQSSSYDEYVHGAFKPPPNSFLNHQSNYGSCQHWIFSFLIR